MISELKESEFYKCKGLLYEQGHLEVKAIVEVIMTRLSQSLLQQTVSLVEEGLVLFMLRIWYITSRAS